MKGKRYSKRVERLMIHALNEATRIGVIPMIPDSEGLMASESAEITIGGKNTVINWSDTKKGDLRFNVCWDYTPERCRRYFRKGLLRDLTGTMPDVSAPILRNIVGLCASCYL